MTSGNYAGVTPEWSDSQVPAVKVTGVYLYLPVPGSRPAFFHRYFFAPSLLVQALHVLILYLISVRLKVPKVQRVAYFNW